MSKSGHQQTPIFTSELSLSFCVSLGSGVLGANRKIAKMKASQQIVNSQNSFICS
jgi:hypothetical protein